MSALTVHPTAAPAPRRRPRHLQVVRPGFVPPAVTPAGSVPGGHAPPGDAAPADRHAIARPSDRSEPLRLTIRGRRVVAAAVLLAGALLSVTVGAWAGQTAGPAAPAETVTVTVGPGESLWSVAESVAESGADPREVVTQIVNLNELASTDVHVGQQLEVPRG